MTVQLILTFMMLFNLKTVFSERLQRPSSSSALIGTTPWGSWASTPPSGSSRRMPPSWPADSASASTPPTAPRRASISRKTAGEKQSKLKKKMLRKKLKKHSKFPALFLGILELKFWWWRTRSSWRRFFWSNTSCRT